MLSELPGDEASGPAAPGDSPGEYGQGFSWVEGEPGSLEEVIEAAFDYRGDVTVLLKDGQELAGYLANRSIGDEGSSESWIEVFPASGDPRRRIPNAQIGGLRFSGKDVASGKSWETWLKKYTERKEAIARGEEVENIDLFPEEHG